METFRVFSNTFAFPSTGSGQALRVRWSYRPAARQPDRILPGGRPRFGTPVDQLRRRSGAGTFL